MFPDVEHVRDMARELDQIIQAGVIQITRLLRNAETSVSSAADDEEDDFEIQRRTPPPLSKKSAALDDVPENRKPAATGARKPAVESLSQRFQNAKGGLSGATANFQLKPGQRLSEQLVKQGLLTPSMLRRIQQELSSERAPGDLEEEEVLEEDDDDDGNFPTQKRK